MCFDLFWEDFPGMTTGPRPWKRAVLRISWWRVRVLVGSLPDLVSVGFVTGGAVGPEGSLMDMTVSLRSVFSPVDSSVAFSVVLLVPAVLVTVSPVVAGLLVLEVEASSMIMNSGPLLAAGGAVSMICAAIL